MLAISIFSFTCMKIDILLFIMYIIMSEQPNYIPCPIQGCKRVFCSYGALKTHLHRTHGAPPATQRPRLDQDERDAIKALMQLSKDT